MGTVYHLRQMWNLKYLYSILNVHTRFRGGNPLNTILAESGIKTESPVKK